MKKLFALLLTVCMMASMMVPAMAAYTSIIPGSSDAHTTTIQHSLTLTEEAVNELLYTITYSYKVDDKATIINATGNGIQSGNEELAVTGAPTIANIVYDPSTVFTNKVATKDMVIDWKGVEISEPGVYRWNVEQSVTSTAPAEAGMTPSNAEPEFYLFMYVVDNNGELSASFRWSKNIDANGLPVYSENEDGTVKKDEIIPEQFPVSTVDLTLIKAVDGTQASKDQYFPFTITLKVPQVEGNKVTDMDFTYSITGSYDKTVAETAYNEETTNPTTINVKDGVGTATVWLKDGQNIEIIGLAYGVEYTIVESGNAGYDVTASVVDGHSEGFSFSVDADTNNATANDASLIEDATVKYVNTKNLSVPTGISLQSGVAFFGLVLAMGMMMLLFVGKRKEQN